MVDNIWQFVIALPYHVVSLPMAWHLFCYALSEGQVVLGASPQSDWVQQGTSTEFIGRFMDGLLIRSPRSSEYLLTFFSNLARGELHHAGPPHP